MKILFLCVSNSARSQLAEGLARKLFARNSKVSIFSAGTEPKYVHPLAIEALNEIGIDTEGYSSKNVAEFLNSKMDLVITLCAEENCPVFLSYVEKLHWPLSDPVNDPRGIIAFREVRDNLQKRLIALGKIYNLL